MRTLTQFCLAACLTLTQFASAGLPAFPDIEVRMGQYSFESGESPLEFTGTLIRDVQVGETRIISLLLRNSGFANLEIAVPAVIEGPDATQFSINFGPDNLLEPGAEAFTVVTYTPTSAGTHNATLRLNSNDPNEAAFLINLTGEAIGAPPEAGLPDIALTGEYTAKSKCSTKKNVCTASGKATSLNLATAPSVGFTWYLIRPYSDGTYDGNSEVLANGFTKKIKAYKGFPAAFPAKKVKFKAGTPPPGDNAFVLLVIPTEGDLDWADNSILINIPL